MEEYILEHAERYHKLVSRFQPEPKHKTQAQLDTATSRDVIVSARIRPLSDEETANGFPMGIFERLNDAETLDVHELKRAIKSPFPSLKSASYEVDHSYGPDATTEQIYNDVVKDLVPWAWGGGIGTLFAYGQTGSGKTYTVSGLEKLVAQALMDGELEGERKIYVSIIELAGNSCYDLLNSQRSISILEDSFGVVQLAGALEHRVTSNNEILSLIDQATKFRRTESTEKNDTSSRSHAICRIRIEIPSSPTTSTTTSAQGGADDGLLYLIDLAGSEAARDKARHGADRMRETREINTSLSVLKDCIRGKAEADAAIVLKGAARSNKKFHVPFRQSALTKVLKHVFDPAGVRSCKTVVLACVNPSLVDIGASKNTLRFAEMLRVFVPKVKMGQYDARAPMTWTNIQLREWIDNNSGSPPVSSDILAPSETGAQILRLPGPEFLLRCLKSPGVIPEQANAFRSKIWQMHIDSQTAAAKGTKPPDSGSNSATESNGGSPDNTNIPSQFEAMEGFSSREVCPGMKNVPFKERIRPGMVVSWTPPRGYHIGMPYAGLKLAVILSPVKSVPEHVRDAGGKLVNDSDGPVNGTAKKYLCAMVSPALLPEAYEVVLWRQVAIEVEHMDTEVLLEYDSATRYYYMAV